MSQITIGTFLQYFEKQNQRKRDLIVELLDIHSQNVSTDKETGGDKTSISAKTLLDLAKPAPPIQPYK